MRLLILAGTLATVSCFSAVGHATHRLRSGATVHRVNGRTEARIGAKVFANYRDARGNKVREMRSLDSDGYTRKLEKLTRSSEGQVHTEERWSAPKRVLDANSRKDYREQLEKELKEIAGSEMWQAGTVVRSLRPERAAKSRG